jgi:uncharacterized protein (DUF302 family)
MSIRIAALALTAALLALSPGAGAAESLVIREAPGSVADTVTRLSAAVEGAGAKIVAVVDHAAGAEAVGSKIPAATLVIFGNPKLGTPIIAANPQAGIDLPVRVLVWDDGGKTKIGYTDPAVLKDRHGVSGADEAFAAMAGALDKLTAKAAGQ